MTLITTGMIAPVRVLAWARRAGIWGSAAWGCAVGALVLSGCAGMRQIDSQVRSFKGSAGPIPAGAEVQVERLPSQQGAEFEPIQQALEQALRTNGLKPVADHAAPWVLQTQWKVRAVEPPRSLSPQHPFGTSMWLGSGGSGASFVFHFPAVEPVWSAFDLDLVLRQRASQAVAFEAHASHQGPWNDIPQLASTLVNAAFQHYPQGKPNLHTVIEEIAR